MKELCDNSQCETCIFYADGGATYVCRLRDFAPVGWNLSDPHRWTQEEVERAKAIKVLWPDAMTVRREGSALAIGWCGIATAGMVMVDGKMFPSIQPGETVTLEEIINAMP